MFAVKTVPKLSGLPIPMDCTVLVSVLVQLPSGQYRILAKEYYPDDMKNFWVENQEEGDRCIHDGTVLKIKDEVDGDIKIVINGVYYAFGDSKCTLRGTLISSELQTATRSKDQKEIANEVLDDLYDCGFAVVGKGIPKIFE